MSAKILAAIDRFYLILTVVLIILSILIIYSFKEIFSLLNTANGIDESAVGVSIKLDKASLDQAYTQLYEKKIIPLDETR